MVQKRGGGKTEISGYANRDRPLAAERGGDWGFSRFFRGALRDRGKTKEGKGECKEERSPD